VWNSPKDRIAADRHQKPQKKISKLPRRRNTAQGLMRTSVKTGEKKGGYKRSGRACSGEEYKGGEKQGIFGGGEGKGT